MNRLTLFFLSLICCAQAGAQATIKGSITGSGKPVAAATVSLLRAADSAWLQTTLSNDDGTFTFSSVASGLYRLNLQAAGFAVAWQQVAVADSAATVAVTMQPAGKALGEVTVTAQKPFIEMAQGKMIVNVANGVNTSGTNALELLKRSPGVQVNGREQIALQGKQGVLVLIDDKPTYLSGDELTAYLKSISSDQIAQIELITQPSARYEASGNAGIINIKLLRSRQQGTSGSVTSSFNKGQYYYNENTLQLQHHSGKTSLLLSLNNSNGASFADWHSGNTFFDPQTGAAAGTQQWASRAVEYFHRYNMRLSADYALTPKTTIGGSAFGIYHTNHMHNSIGSQQQDAAGIQTSTTQGEDEQIADGNVTGNAYLSYHKNEHTALELNLDGVSFSRDFHQQISSDNYDAAMQPVGTTLQTHSSQPRTFSVLSAKADYTTQWKGIAIQAGAKGSTVRTDNDAVFANLQGGSWQPDSLRTNHFLYREQIAAAYIDGSRKLSAKWQLKAGLRAENAWTYGLQAIGNQQFSRSRLALFPTAYINYQADSSNQIELNYGRRIDRPAYNQLNPFRYYSWQYSYLIGNPDLLPQYTHTIELKHTYKSMLTTALSCSRTSGGITDVTTAIPGANATYATYANVASGTSVLLSSGLNRQWTKWCSTSLNAGVFYNWFSGVVGNQPANASGSGWYASAESQFSFGKTWKAECQYYYSGQTIESVLSTAQPSQWLGFGISKKVLHDTTVIKLNVTDPFYVNAYRSTTHGYGFTDSVSNHGDSRTCILSVQYRFGSNKENAAKHEAADTEEAKRARL